MPHPERASDARLGSVDGRVIFESRAGALSALAASSAGRGSAGVPGAACVAASPARAEDWPRFLGPRDNATSRETKLRHDWGKGGPSVLWEFPKGEGFAGPALRPASWCSSTGGANRRWWIASTAETGKALWSYGYDAPYQDRYGSGNGPRISAVIAEGGSSPTASPGSCMPRSGERARCSGSTIATRSSGSSRTSSATARRRWCWGQRLIVQLGGEGRSVAPRRSIPRRARCSGGRRTSGAQLRLAHPGHAARARMRAPFCRRRKPAADRRAALRRCGQWPGAQRHAASRGDRRVGQRLLAGGGRRPRFRQRIIRLGRRADRDRPGFLRMPKWRPRSSASIS